MKQTNRPSQAYLDAVADAQAHHASSKTYSGRLLRPHGGYIKQIIDRLGVRSILDYGCGKGEQYRWVSQGEGASIPAGETLESYWGIEVAKYDPAYPPYAAEPAGTFDLVLCTHVLGSIPVNDMRWVIDRIYGLAEKAVYIAEKIGPIKKHVFRAPQQLPSGWRRQDWELALRPVPPRLEVTLSTRVETNDGVKVTREVVR